MKTEKEDTQTLSPRALEYLELRKIRRNKQKKKKKKRTEKKQSEGRKRSNQDSEVYYSQVENHSKENRVIKSQLGNMRQGLKTDCVEVLCEPYNSNFGDMLAQKELEVSDWSSQTRHIFL